MRRHVEWSRDALDDVKRQIAYIGERNPSAAAKVAALIRTGGDGLEGRLTGRPGRMAGTYEKSVTGLPYVMAYAVRDVDGVQIVSILRVIHTRQHWPKDRWPA